MLGPAVCIGHTSLLKMWAAPELCALQFSCLSHGVTQDFVLTQTVESSSEISPRENPLPWLLAAKAAAVTVLNQGGKGDGAGGDQALMLIKPFMCSVSPLS